MVLFFAVVTMGLSVDSNPDQVKFNYVMVEKGIEWLKLIRSGAGEAEALDFFMQEVAPTRGCQAIIHHWERFRKWDVGSESCPPWELKQGAWYDNNVFDPEATAMVFSSGNESDSMGGMW